MYGLPGYDMARCRQAMEDGASEVVDALEHLGRRLRELTYSGATAPSLRSASGTA